MVDEATQDPCDRQLLEQVIREKSAQAFTQIYRRYQAVLRCAARAYLFDPAWVDDVVQEVWISLWTSRIDRELPHNPVAWLKAIIRFKAIDINRQKMAQRRRSSRIPERDQSACPEAVVLTREKSNAVSTCLSRLSTKQKSVVSLYYFSELSCESIAELRGCPVGTVKSQLHYGRRSLAHEWTRFYAS